MTKKQIDMYDIQINFRVRKNTHEANSIKELRKNIMNGIGNNDMNCIEVEDAEIIIK